MRRTRVLLVMVASCMVLALAGWALAEQDWDEDESIRGKDTAHGMYETWDSNLVRAFGIQGVLETGASARILWRRAMGPHAGFNDMGGPMGPRGLELVEKDDKVFINGGNFRLFWWKSRGGEICEIRVFDGRQWYNLVHHKVVNTIGQVGGPHNEQIPVGFRAFRADTLPNFVAESPADFAGNMPLFFLGEDGDAKFEITKKSPDEIDIQTTGQLAAFNRKRSPLSVVQRLRVFDTGVVLCDFTVALEGKKPCTVREFGLGGTLNDAIYTPLYDDCPVKFMSRMGKPGSMEHKQFFTTKAHLVIDEHLPLFGASFSMPARGPRSYSNSFEMLLESPKGMDGKVVTKPFYTKFDPYSLQYFYSLAWGLFTSKDGKTLSVEPGFAYSNRYVLATGSHRYGSGEGLPRAVRNVLAGRRVAMWQNAGQTGKSDWYPSAGDVKRLADAGLDVLVLGRGWMSAPGEPGKSSASYEPADGAALAAAIDACHARGIRVGLTMLGHDLALLPEKGSWVGKHLKKDFDGVMVEEASFLAPRPPGMAATVTLPDTKETLSFEDGKSPSGEMFLLARHLRTLVGDGGFLLASSDIGPATVSLAGFDAFVMGKGQQAPGSIDEFVDASFLHSCGSVVPTSADARTLAMAAGLGCSFARVIAGRDDIAADLGPIASLWKQCDGLGAEVAVYNGLTEMTGAVRARAVGPTVARQSAQPPLLAGLIVGKTKAVLVTANPSGQKAAASVEIDASRLKLKATTRPVELAPNAIEAITVEHE